MLAGDAIDSCDAGFECDDDGDDADAAVDVETTHFDCDIHRDDVTITPAVAAAAATAALVVVNDDCSYCTYIRLFDSPVAMLTAFDVHRNKSAVKYFKKYKN